MDKSILKFLLKLIGFSVVLFGAHYYILMQFNIGKLQLPLWIIYIFNALLVFVVFATLKFFSKKKESNMLNQFLIFTSIKMVLAIILLLPLFLKKSEHTQLEIFNFFIPYFLFLAFEIFNINKFLQKG